MLLWCAKPEVVVKVRKSNLSYDDQNMVLASYFQEQAHESLSEYLRFKLKNDNTKELFAQVRIYYNYKF